VILVLTDGRKHVLCDSQTCDRTFRARKPANTSDEKSVRLRAFANGWQVAGEPFIPGNAFPSLLDFCPKHGSRR